jgi:autotransporter-associated beta strand protein
VTGFWLGVIAADAQNATWLPFPNLGSSDWNTAANWAPAMVPTAIATFGASNITSITFSNSASVGGLQFNAEAPCRKIGPGSLILSGPNSYGGITAVQEGVLGAGSSTALSQTLGWQSSRSWTSTDPIAAWLS